MIRALWPWALAGLVAPAVVWATALGGVKGLPALGLLLVVLYPTWLFGWWVMGIKSEFLGYALFASTVLGNVAIFSAAGFVFYRLRTYRQLVRWGVTVASYAVISSLVLFIGYLFV